MGKRFAALQVLGTLVTRRLAQQAADWWLITIFAAGGVALSLVINFWIVGAALRPLRDLGKLAKHLQNGEPFAHSTTLKNPDPYTSRMAETLQSLFSELEERNRELRALSERAINAQEEERRSIAQSLHDDTGQALSMLVIHLDRIDERISQVVGTAPHPFWTSACHSRRPGACPGDQVVHAYQPGTDWNPCDRQSAEYSSWTLVCNHHHAFPHCPGGDQ